MPVRAVRKHTHINKKIIIIMKYLYYFRNKIIFISSSFLIITGTFFISCADPETSGPRNEPIYTFDYRDVFFDIIYITKERAVIVGSYGRVLVSHSKNTHLWSPRDSKTKETLTSLSFVNEKSGWAAGHGGIIIHTSDGGETWSVQRESSPENQPILDLQFLSESIGYACGAYDTVLKTYDGGKTWHKLSTGIDNIYNTLGFLNEYVGFLAGEFGTIVKTVDGGRSWSRIDLGGYKGTLFGLNVMPPGRVIAYGIKGKLIMSWDGGQTWSNLYSGVSEPLFRAAFNGKDIAVVGRTGTILLSNNSGGSFTVKWEEDLTSLAGVCAHPEGGFMCVGELGKILKVETIK